MEGTCNCTGGFDGQFCEIEPDPCGEISCKNGGTCVDGTCDCPDGFGGEFCQNISGLQFRTEFGSVETLNKEINGIFAIWWGPEFDHSGDTEVMFELLNKVRNDCLTKFNMEDPPNPTAGYYYNVYIHHGMDETVLPTWWGNGQGTDTYGMPYLTLPAGLNTDYGNISHEGFHIFQYNSNSTGFDYSGDSQWYVEATAQWYMSQNVPDGTDTFIEAGSIGANPHITLWHSFTNQALGDPTDWFFQVRQYGMHMLLHYLTEEKSVDPDIIVGGYYASSELNPQQYLAANIGLDNLREYFADWSAHNTGGFDYISEAQYNRALVEMSLSGDPTNSHPYAIELTDEEANGTFSPEDDLRPRSWSYSVVKINNSAATSYTFDLTGDATGSEGADAYFLAKIIVVGANGQVRYQDATMDDATSGSATVEVQSNETEVYLNVVSVPDHYFGNQTYDYEVTISRN
ncbi:MAG: DUF6055 domain-containing protein [Bacteroidota bacterium]